MLSVEDREELLELLLTMDRLLDGVQGADEAVAVAALRLISLGLLRIRRLLPALPVGAEVLRLPLAAALSLPCVFLLAA